MLRCDCVGCVQSLLDSLLYCTHFAGRTQGLTDAASSCSNSRSLCKAPFVGVGVLSLAPRGTLA